LLLLPLAVGLFGGKHGVTVLLNATLVNCEFFNFSFPFSFQHVIFYLQDPEAVVCAFANITANIFLNGVFIFHKSVK